MICTLIADRMALIRAGLVACLSCEPDIEVVAELDRREPVLPAVAATWPDVAVIDDGIAAADGFAVIADLHDAAPTCRTLIMATRPCPRDLRRAVAAHTTGFVRKDADPMPSARPSARSPRASKPSTPTWPSPPSMPPPIR